MIGTATITGKTGPERTVTALAAVGVTSVLFDIENEIVRFNFTPNGGQPRTLDIAMSDLSTVTSTIVEGVSLDIVVTNA